MAGPGGAQRRMGARGASNGRIRVTRLFLEARPATADELAALSALDYGHFTTLQVRDRAAQGLDLHLQRLQEATRELFDQRLDAGRIREAMCGALDASGLDDCSLRLTVCSRDFDPRRPGLSAALDLLVRIAPPAAPDGHPLRLKSFACSRLLPHLKHVGIFPLFHQRRLAVRAGFDDALLVDASGRISEGTFWNIGFIDGDTVVWPDAPALRGTCERLLQRGLSALGAAQVTRPVGLAELGGFRGAFIANARGLQAVAAVDDVAWAPDTGLAGLLGRALASQPWQPLQGVSQLE